MTQLNIWINNPKKIKKTKFVIAIDAGHAEKDPRAVVRGGTLEKDIVLSISKKLYKLLKKEVKKSLKNTPAIAAGMIPKRI